MILWLWIIIFIASLTVLMKSSDYFVEYSKKIAHALKVHEFIIGVTLVAIGTSLPELMTGIFSTVKNATTIVASNAFGSNITNILLVIGVLAVLSKKTVKTDFEINKIDVPLLAISTLIAVFIVWDGKVTFFEGVFAILAYSVYMIYALKEAGKDKEKRVKGEFKWWHLIVVIISAVGIYFGAEYSVVSVIKISQLLNVAVSVISATAIALGTSLPELMVSISAIKKQSAGIAIGNVLGSNIFNGLMVLGVPALIKPLLVDSLTLHFVLPFMVGVTLTYLFVISDKEISKYEGAMMLIVYLLFVLKVIGVI